MKTYLFQRIEPVSILADGEIEAREQLASWVADPVEWELVDVRGVAVTE